MLTSQDDAELDKFLANPTGDIHGTNVRQSSQRSDRQNVIAYLHTLKK
jgi:cytochrome c2